MLRFIARLLVLIPSLLVVVVAGVASYQVLVGQIKDEVYLLQLILYLLTGIVVTELIERVAGSWLLEARIQTLSSEVRLAGDRGFNAEYLDNKKRIIAKAADLMHDVDHQMRAFLVGGANSPPELADEIAKALRRKKEAGEKTIFFHAVIAIDFNKVPESFITGLDEKYRIYQKSGLANQVRLYLLDQKNPLGTDTIILDTKHVVFAFSDPREAEAYKAVFLQNQDKLAEIYTTWFDRVVFQKAVEYEEAKKNHIKQVKDL